MGIVESLLGGIGGKVILAALAAAGAFLGLFLFGQSKKKQGATEERAKRNEQEMEISDAMDSVPEPSSDELDDSLSNDRF